MKNLVLVIILLVCSTACQNGGDAQLPSTAVPASKKVEVEFRPNIHMSHVIELFVWPGEYPTRPMVVAAQEYFAPFKNHPAVVLSDSLLQNEVFYFDELTEILLYMEDFPSTTFKHPLSHSPYKDKEVIINRWVNLLAAFYQEADVEGFLQQHQAFYQGARQEVVKNLPPEDFAQQIEAYYRDTKLQYTIIPAPEMPTGGAYGQRGIGPYVYTPKGLEIYQVISASLPIQKDSISGTYNTFGFNNKEFVLRNSYHEFGHAFVNPILDKASSKVLLEKYKHLFIDELREVMTKQNYDNWFDCIAEHLVRLGEIRLADRSGNQAWAAELRNYHTVDKSFVFLPELEQKILVFEQSEDYNSFEAFLPELMEVLQLFDGEKIRGRIGEGQ
ncbi:MAG: DUF4932 domain-containing protein [Bacteroidota bacterium]